MLAPAALSAAPSPPTVAQRLFGDVWGDLVCPFACGVFFRVFLHISSQLPYPNRDGEVSKISSFYPTAPESTLAGKAAQLSQVRDNWDQRDDWDRRGHGSHGQHPGVSALTRLETRVSLSHPAAQPQPCAHHRSGACLSWGRKPAPGITVIAVPV